MEHVLKSIKFSFRNGDEWNIDHSELDDIWAARITTSIGRIQGGRIVEIHPCKSFKAEILPEADHVKVTDITNGSLETGMFDRVTKYQDIEKCRFVFGDEDKEPMTVYFPFRQKDSLGLDNQYQTSQVSEKDGHLYIVIDAEHTVHDIYPNA